MVSKFFFAILFLFSLQATTQSGPTPTTIFYELWTEFDKEYAGFEPRAIDWNQVKIKYQGQVNNQMSDDALFDLLHAMILELNDAHVGMRANINGEVRIANSFNYPNATDILKRYGTTDSFFITVDSTLWTAGFKEVIKVSDKVSYAYNGSVGYLRVNSFLNSKADYDEALDKLLPCTPKAMIIDIRLNQGGTDYYLLKLAGRFLDKKIIGYHHATRISGTNDYTKLDTRNLAPASGEKYLRPTYVLTSNFTVSAAEVFAMAMKELPNVTLVGEPTNGSLSHVKQKKLSNGWEFSISHQRTYSADKVNYEGEGVPPDKLVKDVNSDLSKDLVLLNALELALKL